jgi:hypothetical protein
MKSVLTVLGFLALMAVIVIGFEYRIPVILALISLGLSLSALVMGVRMIVTRTAELPTSDTDDTKHEHHRGFTAVLWGIMFLMIAAPFAIYSVGYFVFGLESVGDAFGRVVSSPRAGTLLGAAAGVGFLLFGLTRLFGGKATFADTTIGPGQRILSGVFTSALGSLIVTAAIMESIMPGSFTRIRDAAISWTIGFAK